MASDPSNLKLWPRVLIISDEAPQSGTAGGLLLHRLFAAYPSDRLRVVTHFVPTIGDPLPGVVYKILNPRWQRFEKSRFNRWKRTMRAYGLVPVVSPIEVERLSEGFATDVVLSVMQHSAYFDTALNYARKRRLPLVAVVHDVNEQFEPVFPWALAAAKRRDGDFYRYAIRRLCVSPEMEQFGKIAYGVTGSVLYPNRASELNARPFSDCDNLRNPPTLTLGFAGNFNFGYGDGILEMLPALRKLKIRIVAYGRPPNGTAAALMEQDFFEYRGFVPSAETWTCLKRDCDAVWLPYTSRRGQMEQLYRHHFPSKLPEYLALGMPVIVTGPGYATGMRWAKDNLGKELVAASTGEFEEVLANLARDPNLRRNLAKRCQETGQRDFDPGKIAAEFLEHLQGAAAGISAA
jgi:glycosyltransferase involved in cell wall biosynthesis